MGYAAQKSSHRRPGSERLFKNTPISHFLHARVCVCGRVWAWPWPVSAAVTTDKQQICRVWQAMPASAAVCRLIADQTNHRQHVVIECYFRPTTLWSRYRSRSAACVCVCLCTTAVKWTDFDTNIWHTNPSSLYIGQVRKSTAWAKVQGHMWRMFLFNWNRKQIRIWRIHRI